MPEPSNHPSSMTWDLVVIGAGSGGLGAAWSAASLGSSVLLIEKSTELGGNAVRGGVHAWEMGVGGTGLPFLIYRRLRKIPLAVGLYTRGRHCLFPEPGQPVFPGGENLIDPNLRYIDSLRRFGARSFAEDPEFTRCHWHGVVFEPVAYEKVVADLLAETGNCRLATGRSFIGVEVEGRRVRQIELNDGTIVKGRFFIDATADIHLAAAAGCSTRDGQESVSEYGEPGAPDSPNQRLNGTTLVYRITRRGKDAARIDPVPDDIPTVCWWRPSFPLASVNQYPNGDYNWNMLPTMEGEEVSRLGYVAAYQECQRRVLAHWRHTQTTLPEMQHYRLSWIAPALGVRESKRLLARYILTEHDLEATLERQNHSDIITIADHSKDTHSDHKKGRMQEMTFPYGVPFRCLLPREIDNLAVACRGAGFSSIAASSCRLSRTMMQLGQAAGTAAALAVQQKVLLPEIPPVLLREALQKQRVQLEWPAPPDLQEYLESEEVAEP